MENEQGDSLNGSTSSIPAIDAGEGGSRKRAKHAICRKTCMGDIDLSNPCEAEAVSTASDVIETAILKHLTQELSLDSVKGRRIAGSVAKVATDLVAWGVSFKIHPEDDVAERYIGTFDKELRSAAKARGITEKQKGPVVSLALRLATREIEQYLRKIYRQNAEIQAGREADHERKEDAEEFEKDYAHEAAVAGFV